MTEYLRIGRRDVKLTHPEKVLFAKAGLTKRDLARHYERVAEVMLPYVRERPLALQAFPDGIDGKGFFMKNLPKYFPEWVGRATMDKRDGTVTHVLANDAATLVYLAGQNVITPHQWLSRADEPRKPDRLIIDFDPSGTGFADVRAAARDAGDRLRAAGLEVYAMVTGSRGIHVIAPMRRDAGFSEVHRFARAMAEDMVRDNPKRLTLEWHKAERGTKIFVDVNRNAYAQHAVSPYGVRARPRAPVATPLHWEELADGSLKPDRWTVKTIGARVEAEGDPWKGMNRRARKLPPSEV